MCPLFLPSCIQFLDTHKVSSLSGGREKGRVTITMGKVKELLQPEPEDNEEEYVAFKITEAGANLETVDFDRFDYEALHDGVVRYVPDVNCTICHGKGNVKTELGVASCPCADITVCGLCRGTGEISEDGSDGEGNIQRGVETRTCPCKKKIKFEE